MDDADLSWTEKYRPTKLDEVIGQEAIISRLSAFVKVKNFPSMIFAGPAGVGKTTSAIAMAKELYGDVISSLNFDCTIAIDIIQSNLQRPLVGPSLSPSRACPLPEPFLVE